jgi:predicted nucleotidyltransferase
MAATQHPFGEYARIITTLANAGVEFVICGGVACVFYGVPRNTHDIDLLVRLTDDNLVRFVSAVRSLQMQPRIPEPLEALRDPQKRSEWIERKKAVVYTLVSSQNPLQIDVFLAYPISFEDAWRNARLAEIDGVQFRLSSVEDLIRAKQAVQPRRETDEFDIRHLERMIGRAPRAN